MIDIENLEIAANSGSWFRAYGPYETIGIILSLIGEVRAVREILGLDPRHAVHAIDARDEVIQRLDMEVAELNDDLQAAKLLAHANGEMFKAERQDAAKLRAALQSIAAIEDKMFGGDWDEIEEARDIANKALNPPQSFDLPI